MKKTLLVVLIFLAGMATTVILSWRSNTIKPANPDSRPIIALRKVKAKAGVSADAFQKWAATLPENGHGKIPGAKFYIAKGQRGDEAGTYLFVIEFDSKRTRDFNYPIAGADSTKISMDARRLLQSWDKIAADFTKVGEVVTTGKESYTDYIVLQ